MTTPQQPDANKPAVDKAAEAVAGRPLDKPVSETLADAKDEAKDRLTDAKDEAKSRLADAKDEAEDRLADAGAAARDKLDDAKDSLQQGFSRFDETARKVSAQASEQASEMADNAAEKAQVYAHQGLDSLNRAGTAVAGAITQRPFVALISALLGGAMVALARR